MNGTLKICRRKRRFFFAFFTTVLIVSLALWQFPFLALAQDQTDEQESFSTETYPQIEEETFDESLIEDEVLETSDLPETQGPEETTETLDITEVVESSTDDPLLTDPNPRASINGQCGTSSWTLNTTTGELQIGPGTLKSCDSASAWSWHSYRLYVNSITFTGTVYTNAEAQFMFFNMKNLKTINYFDRLYTTSARNISGMFMNCINLSSLTFPLSFNTAKVIDMSSFFSGCTKLTSVNIIFFDSSSTSTMAGMFEGCTSLIQVRVGSSFALTSDGTLPSPSGQDSQGNLFSGNWKAVSNGVVYPPNAILPYAADTYLADTLTPSASISGSPLEGQTLTGIVHNGGSYDWQYQWSRSDSQNGPFVYIPGSNSLSYTTTTDDVGRYLRFKATYSGIQLSAIVGPIEKGVPATPTLDAANLISDGSILLDLTTAASMENAYESVLVAYMTESGVMKEYGEVPCYSTSIETKTLSIDLASEFEGDSVPTMIYFWIRAKNTAGLSEWSNMRLANPSPQISVTVPTSISGAVSADGAIITHDSPQLITNTGTLNVKITNISFSQKQANHPVSDWRCVLETDPNTTLWEGTSKSDIEVKSSPVIRPGNDIGLIWSGSMINTNGINLTSIPLDYAVITYTFSFASS